MDGIPEEYRRILHILNRVDFFGRIKTGELDLLMKRLRRMTCPKGHVIIKEGEMGETFYLISRGRVSIWKKKGMFKKVLLETLGAEEFFGEMALVTNERRNATVIAEDDCELFILYKEDFKEILMTNPTTANSIEEIVRERKAKNV